MAGARVLLGAVVESLFVAFARVRGFDILSMAGKLFYRFGIRLCVAGAIISTMRAELFVTGARIRRCDVQLFVKAARIRHSDV